MDLTSTPIFGTIAQHKTSLENLLAMSSGQRIVGVERRRQFRIEVMKDQCPRFYTKEEAQRQINEISFEYLVDWHQSAIAELEKRQNK